MNIWKIAGIALVVVLAASVVTGSLAFAQSQGPNTSGATEQVAPRGPGFDGPRGGRMGRGGGMDEITLEYVADALGLTVEELQAELDAGKRLPEIAEELGVEAAALEEAFKAARVAHIEQAVADGELTQEQADAILERMEQAQQISEAMEAMRNAQIEEALADGIITEEQAKLLQGLGGRGGFGFGGRQGGRMGPRGPMSPGQGGPMGPRGPMSPDQGGPAFAPGQN